MLSTALRLQGKLDEAQTEAQLACRREYGAYWPRISLAAIRLGKRDSASALDALNDAYRAKPNLTPEQIRYLVGQRIARDLLALRK